MRLAIRMLGNKLRRNVKCLTYDYFRTYDARTGRYTQADPIGMRGGWSQYTYVAGNPLSYVDPRGLAWQLTASGGGALIIPGLGGSLNVVVGVSSVVGDLGDARRK